MTMRRPGLNGDQVFMVKVILAALTVLSIGLLGIFGSSVGGLSWDYAHTSAGQPLFERYSFAAGLLITIIWLVAVIAVAAVWFWQRRHRIVGVSP
ncbi:hypothetical protein [Rhodococcus sp. BP22]|uniref:hypothetical protein n=1 Tax=Rhodococcus sp. BP22 TaxID=2758566 RepID=UPI0016464818|nr:hypothetical protein [Rhodococcus sp. BP22]